MRNIKIVLVVLLATVAFSGCAGDHSASDGKDTEQNSYHVTDSDTKGDTVSVITHTGDSASADYSSTGGAQLIKPDTNKKK